METNGDLDVKMNQSAILAIVQALLMFVTFIVGGTTGVFNVEEVVDLLEDEKAQDICVIRVLPELKYVDFMVLATGRSTRHIRAMAAYIKWVVGWFSLRLL